MKSMMGECIIWIKLLTTVMNMQTTDKLIVNEKNIYNGWNKEKKYSNLWSHYMDKEKKD